MTISALLLLVLFFLFLAIGVRISFIIGILVMLGTLIFPITIDVVSIAQHVSSELARSWVLICVPLFIFLGQIIEESGIAGLMIDAFNIFFGKLPGGLAIINVVAGFFFGGISGSAAAETAAIGGVLIPIMVEEGYPADFSTVVTITSSTLGPIVPPSILMIVFAWLTGTSVAGLFASGFIPGAFLAMTLSILCYIISSKRQYGKKTNMRYSFKKAMAIIFKAMPVFLLPIIIVGGVLGGIFTATESASVAVVVALFLSFFIYRTLSWRKIPRMLVSTVRMTGTCILLVVFASALSWILTFSRLPNIIAEIFISLHFSAIAYLITSCSIMLILGCFINPTAILLMTIPLLYPSAVAIGIHPLHYALTTVVALSFGHVTPPVGASLFIGSSISGVPIGDLILPLMPFLAVMLLTLIIMILFPGLIMFLPRLLGYV